ncbi:MAG: ATP-binding protein [Patescibacteria group bacterium]|nr:ATP-binding protein [Patescibacteria group bacterium]
MLREGSPEIGIEIERDKEKILKCLKDLYELDDFLSSDEFFTGAESFLDNLPSDGVIDSARIAVMEVIKKDVGLKKHFEHDVTTLATTVLGNLRLLEKKKGEVPYKTIEFLQKNWSRFFVSVEDLLLRALPDSDVKENARNFTKLQTLHRVMEYFVSTEFKSLKEKSMSLSKEVNPGTEIKIDSDLRSILQRENHYDGIENRELNVIADWNELERKLAGRQIVMDQGVLLNFILNAIRNPLKKAIEVAGKHTNIRVEIKIVGEELLVKISDTGKGMEDKHLDPNDPSCIFNKGASSTNSTGLGLTNFQNRFRIFGGKLEVFSRRYPSNEMDDTPFVYYSNYGEKEVNFTFYSGGDAKEIVQSQIDDHGTEFTLHVPLVV